MDKVSRLNVFVGDLLAGELIRENAHYRFTYGAAYQGPPVFLGWPLNRREYTWDNFPPAFDSLLPEGVLLEQLLMKDKLDRADKWGQLVAVGLDLTGFVAVLPTDSELKPYGKIVPGQKLRKRMAIQPGEQAIPYTTPELVAYHGKHTLRMSLSGVQPKVSAVFSRKKHCFQVVESNGSYILKPSPQAFPGAAENEALTMKLARQAGIAVPRCGWLPALDAAGVFWIERFDRWGASNRQRVRCEDVCQILNVPASWKYLGNLETLARIIREHCSNPQLQLARLFQRVLFCWLTGNGDMHLKNWSLLENGPLIELAPAYDYLNTRLLIEDEEESALALDDRKTGYDAALLIDYFGREVCKLNDKIIENFLDAIKRVRWKDAIRESRLSDEDIVNYIRIVEERFSRLNLSSPK